MSKALTTQSPEPMAVVVTMEKAQSYAEQAKAANTRKAYQSDWKHFSSWCSERGYHSLPATPEAVVLYITELADSLKTSTIQRRLATISQAHQLAGLESPTKSSAVKLVASGIRREKGVAQVGKAPVLTSDLKQMVALLPDTLLGKRDRAILLLGFAAALRRSELVGLDFVDVTFNNEGAVIRLRRSKTDQEGQGTTIGIPYGSRLETCPVRSLKAWIEASNISEGSLFRGINRHGQVQANRLTDQSVALIVKRSAEASGIDPASVSGHSLRAGLATQAAIAGVSDRSIMKQTRHRTRVMVDRYVRDASLFRDNAASALGL